MKIRIMKLTPELLTQLLQGKTFASNLPDDAELLDLKMDLFSKQIQAIIRSDSFENVAESYPISEFVLTSTSVSKVVSKSVPAAKQEPKIVTAKPLQTNQPSKTALKMENEFSPEQRKVLSFMVKGDYVIVKPIQFLKEEWEDINEVVRSLGGRWVKGDIISYWEIPLQQVS
ncbi:MAG: hypothetical protein ACXV2C_07170 [Candidatus Bathyarchaeia archaeon]